MDWIVTLILGAIIGSIAGSITKKRSSMGCVTKIIAGLLGSTVGAKLFGDLGPEIADIAIIPSILGAVIVITVVSFFVDSKK